MPALMRFVPLLLGFMVGRGLNGFVLHEFHFFNSSVVCGHHREGAIVEFYGFVFFGDLTFNFEQ